MLQQFLIQQNKYAILFAVKLLMRLVVQVIVYGSGNCEKAECPKKNCDSNCANK